MKSVYLTTEEVLQDFENDPELKPMWTKIKEGFLGEYETLKDFLQDAFQDREMQSLLKESCRYITIGERFEKEELEYGVRSETEKLNVNHDGDYSLIRLEATALTEEQAAEKLKELYPGKSAEEIQTYLLAKFVKGVVDGMKRKELDKDFCEAISAAFGEMAKST